MSNSQLQSLKSKNATVITQLHEEVRRARSNARYHYDCARDAIKQARAQTVTIKKLAKNQVKLKAALRGAPKARRPAKADSRIAPVNPKVGGALFPIGIERGSDAGSRAIARHAVDKASAMG